MTLPDALRAAQADPTLAIRVVGGPLSPVRCTAYGWRRWASGFWTGSFPVGELVFSVGVVLAEWETVPVKTLEAART